MLVLTECLRSIKQLFLHQSLLPPRPIFCALLLTALSKPCAPSQHQNTTTPLAFLITTAFGLPPIRRHHTSPPSATSHISRPSIPLFLSPTPKMRGTPASMRIPGRQEMADNKAEARLVATRKRRLDILVETKQYTRQRRPLILGVEAYPLEGDGTSEAKTCEETIYGERSYRTPDGCLIVPNLVKQPVRRVRIKKGRAFEIPRLRYHNLAVRISLLRFHNIRYPIPLHEQSLTLYPPPWSRSKVLSITCS